MKISIKLANGIEITREFTAEQLQKAENTKEFRQANKRGKVIKHCSYNHYGNQYCFGKCQQICKEQTEKRIDSLTNYINVLQNIH